MKTMKYDVAVVGGGSAGVAAALAASRNGASTILIERHGTFGGEATNSWIPAYCGFFTRGEVPEQVVFGIGEELLQGLKAKGEDVSYTISPSTGNASVRFHPEKVKLVLDELLEASNVDYRLLTTLIDVEVDGNHINAITIMDDEEKTRIEAKAFVDTTGDANLIHMAGLQTDWGNEQGEVQQSSLSCLVENIPSEDIKISTLNEAILKGKEAGIPHLYKEKGMIVKVASDDYGYLTIPSVSIESMGAKELTSAMINLRKQAESYAKTIQTYAPGFEKMRLAATAPFMGVREGRRMRGVSTITGQDVLDSKKDPTNTIAKGGWPAEVHSKAGLHYTAMKDNDYFDIPYTALMSKDIDNLFAGGRCISCDSLALASLRVMGTGFATGQAAGVIASVYNQDQEIDVQEVQNVLKKQGACL